MGTVKREDTKKRGFKPKIESESGMNEAAPMVGRPLFGGMINNEPKGLKGSDTILNLVLIFIGKVIFGIVRISGVNAFLFS